MEGLYDCVLSVLRDKIQDVYIEMQDLIGIKNGDNPIDYVIDEIVTTEKLAKIITETLEWQKGGDK